jgi:hypothetical protein
MENTISDIGSSNLKQFIANHPAVASFFVSAVMFFALIGAFSIVIHNPK